MRGQNMPLPADFVDAHRRHWDDAELLFDHARWASADQMYGFSAECGLKAVMKALEMPVDDDTGAPKKRRHWKHVQDLWPVFRTFAQGHGGARYSGRLPEDNPFRDWSHHDRYAHRGHWEEASLERHREAAREVLNVVQLAQQDGRS